MTWIYLIMAVQIIIVLGVSLFLIRKIYNLYVERKNRKQNQL